MLLPVEDFAEHFGFAFSALLPLINPVSGALMFVGLVGPAPSAVYRKLARRVAINTTLFLLVTLGVGTAMLKFFGISLPVVQVAGGLALAAMGWKLLDQEQAQPKQGVAQADDHAFRSLEQKTFYPFTFPMTAGPGCIVVMVTLSAHASLKGLLPDVLSHAGVVLAVLILCLGVYLCYAYAPAITAHISQQTAHGVMRVVAFVLLCIGVQIMWNGTEALLKAVLKR